jgi:hypothetical protein
MILNARQNGFIFNFPKGFIVDSVVEKYEKYVKRMPIPYDTVNDFINSTIQQVNFPTLRTIDTTEQIRPGGFKQSYKSATTLQNLIQRDFTVTFKLGEGFINYWILYENIIKFLDFQNPDQYLQDFRLLLLDNEGVIMASVLLQQPIFTSLSEIQLNYASSTPQFSTFSIGFKCNYVDVKLEIG